MNATVITVEPGGLVLRGVAVPWNEETVVVSPSPNGERIVHREVFGDRSIVGVGVLLPPTAGLSNPAWAVEVRGWRTRRVESAPWSEVTDQFGP